MEPKLTDRDIVIRLATEIMGWHTITSGVCWWRGDRAMRCGTDWNPLKSIADAFELEGAIPEENRWRYVMSLRELVAPEEEEPTLKLQWLITHASPRQRCMAALSILEEK